MLVRLIQATAMTLALYGLLGLNTLKVTTIDKVHAEAAEPAEVLVALKQVLTNRQ